MKKIVLSIFAFSAIFTLHSQLPTFNWSATQGGDQNDGSNSITTDDQGNVYSVGNFSSVADFDPGTGVSNLTSFGNSDVFVTKLDPTGNLLWARQLGGIGNDNAHFISIDPNGDLIILGTFEGTADFDPLSTVVSKVSAGLTDIFMTKLNSDGLLDWVYSIGSTGFENVNDGFVDNSGNIYIVGDYTALMDFDPTVGYTSMSAQMIDGFILKLTNDCNFHWVKKIGGNGAHTANAVTVDSQGSVVIAGNFDAATDFDPGAGTSTLTPVSGANAMYITKLSSTGLFGWAKSIGASMAAMNAVSMVTDNANNVYLAGSFSGSTIDFDPSAAGFYLSSNGGLDVFILKLNTAGLFSWAKNIGSTSTDSPGQMILSNANLLITGGIIGAVDMDPGTGVSTLTASNGVYSDAFLLSLSDQGDFLNALRFGGDDTDNANSMAKSLNGFLYISGLHTATSDMDPGTPNYPITATGSGVANAFVSQFSVCDITYGTDVQNACFSFTWIDGLTYSASNSTATFTLTNQGGCDSLVTLNLTITPLPDLTITQNGTTLSVAESGLQYQWIDCGNGDQAVPGANSQSFTPTVNGSYAVEVTNGSCSETSNCTSISTIGIEENNTFQLSVQPNPSADKITVVSSSEIDEVLVYASSGELVMVETNSTFNIEQLARGVYILKVKTENGIGMIRLIKQ
ncbi:MAG: T9SS type A sorting domain-containing protein [Bacteroidota bacterium]